MRIAIATLCLALAVFSCRKHEDAAPPAATASTETSAPAPPPAATTTAEAASEPSLTSFSAGALVVQRAQEYDPLNWSSFWLTDGRPDSGWASPENVITPQTVIIALPERTQLERIAFDTASIDGDGRGVKDVIVEMSDTSATSGFQTIANVSLQDNVDNQIFPVSAQLPGRWLRVTMQNNHGAKDYLELFDIRGYGKQLTQTPFPDASGTYETDYGNFHLKQEGTSVTGCYEHNGGLLTGGIEGRVMKFTWREDNDNSGPALMVFSPDGREMLGLWWRTGETNHRGSSWNGTKISGEVGSCPHWSGKSGGAEAQMTKELEEFGRTRVYGINFDVDSDVIRGESKPTLDKIAAVLRAKPEWKLKIEGHTDSTGGDAHNRQLSQKRADAVKAYLVAAGIDGSRLSTAGLGATVPVAGNETEPGRAQNRRVELAKE